MNEVSYEKARSDGGVANAEQGQVVLDGPDGVAITLTPEAAERTGQSLIEAAQEARRQIQTPDSSPAR